MKKLTTGIAVLSCLVSFQSFAAPVTAKNETNAPYYNSGMGFGLAGFESAMSQEKNTNVSEHGLDANELNYSTETYYE